MFTHLLKSNLSNLRFQKLDQSNEYHVFFEISTCSTFHSIHVTQSHPHTPSPPALTSFTPPPLFIRYSRGYIFSAGLWTQKTSMAGQYNFVVCMLSVASVCYIWRWSSSVNSVSTWQVYLDPNASNKLWIYAYKEQQSNQTLNGKKKFHYIKCCHGV